MDKKIKIELSQYHFSVLKWVLEDTIDELSLKFKYREIKDRKQILAMLTLQPLLRKMHSDSFEMNAKMKVNFTYAQAIAFMILYTDKLLTVKPTKEVSETIMACITTLDQATTR